MAEQVHLDATQSIEFASYAAKCDGRVEGFRLAMEVMKAEKLAQMKRHEAKQPPPAPPPAKQAKKGQE